MAQIEVNWLKNHQFVGTDSTKHSIVISSTGPEDGVGMKPSELLLVSLGSCTSYDIVNILTKKREKLMGLRVVVTAEQDPEPPWTFRKFHIHYEVTGHRLNPDAVEQAIRLSEEKYCSVSTTLKQAAEITYDYEIIDTSGEI